MENDNFEPNLPKKAPDTGTIEAETAAPEAKLIKNRPKDIRAVFAALSHRDYRYFWIGAFLSSVGTWLQMAALPWLVYQMTKSALVLGLVSFASTVPVFIFGLSAGVAADRFNRRKLIIASQTIMMLSAFALGAFVSFKIATIPAIVLIVLAGGVALAYNFPAWQAIVPDLVPKQDLLNAVALNSAQFNAARLIGPAIAGIVLATWGVASCFYLNSVSFLTVIIAMLLIHPRPQPIVRREDGVGIFAHTVSGIKHAKEHSAIGIMLLCVGVISLAGTPYTTLMPIFAKRILNVGSREYAFLLGASGLGAVIGALLASYLSRLMKKATLVKGAILLLAGFLLVFAGSPYYWLSFISLVGVGASLLAASSSINTAIQSSIPNQIRGRIMSLYVLMFLGMMPFGSLIFGSIAHFTSAPVAIAIGAGVCGLMGLLIITHPRLLSEVTEQVTLR